MTKKLNQIADKGSQSTDPKLADQLHFKIKDYNLIYNGQNHGFSIPGSV